MEDDQAAAQARAKSAARAAAQQIEEAAKSRAKQERAARAREWDEEEVRMLEKAMARFPQGTAKRWEQVGCCGPFAKSPSVGVVHTQSPMCRKGASGCRACSACNPGSEPVRPALVR